MKRRGFLKAVGAVLASAGLVGSRETVEAAPEPVFKSTVRQEWEKIEAWERDTNSEIVFGVDPAVRIEDIGHEAKTITGASRPYFNQYMKEKWLPKEDAPECFGVDRSPCLGVVTNATPGKGKVEVRAQNAFGQEWEHTPLLTKIETEWLNVPDRFNDDGTAIKTKKG